MIPLLLSNPSELTGADKLQVFAWLNKGRSMDPNVIRLLLGETTGDMDLREMYLGTGDEFSKKKMEKNLRKANIIRHACISSEINYGILNRGL